MTEHDLGDVEREAALWAVRHPLSISERRILDAWLAADPRRSGALLRAQAGWTSIGRAWQHSLDEPAGASVQARSEATGFGRRVMVGAMAASLVAGITGIAGWQFAGRDRTTTARGEIRRLPLADGSVAMIDTESALDIALRRDVRAIALIRGQAWFQVAKDRRRPFVVDAGLAHARAVGTAFSVRRDDTGVRIAVTEGRVAIWPTHRTDGVRILTAGDYADFPATGAAPRIVTAPGAIDRQLAWRDGEIALDGDTLAEAAARFNLYNRRHIVIGDAQLAREPLVGLFRIGNPGEFAATIAEAFDAEVTETDERIVIMPKKQPAELTEKRLPRNDG